MYKYIKHKKFHFFGSLPSPRPELELTTSGTNSPNRKRPKRLNHPAILAGQKKMFSITNGTYRGCNASFEWLIQMEGHAIYYAPHVKQKKLIGTLQPRKKSFLTVKLLVVMFIMKFLPPHQQR